MKTAFAALPALLAAATEFRQALACMLAIETGDLRLLL